MKELFDRNNFRALVFWLSPTIITIIAFAFAIIFKKLGVSMEGDLTDFYSSFIALCTTFIVGFQIYSTMELNKRIKELDDKNQMLEQKTRDIDVMSNIYWNVNTIMRTL